MYLFIYFIFMCVCVCFLSFLVGVGAVKSESVLRTCIANWNAVSIACCYKETSYSRYITEVFGVCVCVFSLVVLPCWSKVILLTALTVYIDDIDVSVGISGQEQTATEDDQEQRVGQPLQETQKRGQKVMCVAFADLHFYKIKCLELAGYKNT
jgi:hypothetical protein